MVSIPVVYILDDDLTFRQTARFSAERMGLHAETYAAAGTFLEAARHEWRGCLVLDHHLPDMTGLQVLQLLRRRKILLPVILVSGAANVTLAVEAMRHGAVTVLEKPISLHQLFEQVLHAFELDRQRHAARGRKEHAAARLGRLTEKERQVVELLAAGRTNKQMAAKLDISLRAVEDRRARVMKKLEAQSLADIFTLLRDAEQYASPEEQRSLCSP